MRGHKSTLDKSETKGSLRIHLKPGSTVYTILQQHTAHTRHIALVVVTANGTIRHLGGWAAAVLDQPVNDDLGVVQHGGGMDMGFDLVYRLSRELFNDGYALNHRWL